MTATCPFCAILSGDEPGKIITRDEENRFALIQSIHPTGAIHWLAVPFEHVESIEKLEQTDPQRFLKLVEFALSSTRAQRQKHPLLRQGFTLKLHFGSFETIPHAKLHVLNVE